MGQITSKVGVKNVAEEDINPATEETLDTIKTNTNSLNPYSGEPITNHKIVSIAGTAEVLSTSTPVKWVIIKALNTNTGDIYIGNSSVNSSNGYVLTAGEAIGLDFDNLNNIYIDSAVDGEGVNYIARG